MARSKGASAPGRRDTRRRFEQWASNPGCEANTLSAVHGIPMAAVANQEGGRPSMGQSPFALARGVVFEAGLFREQAQSLRAELEYAEVLAAGSAGFRDLRIRKNSGPMSTLDDALEETTQLLKDIAAGSQRPSIVASPTLLIPSGVMLPEALLVVDVLAIHYERGGARISVGEIKTYPDRAGYTDTAQLAQARAQAGVYVHALGMVIGTLGLSERLRVEQLGFLVLSRPGFNRPSVRAREDLRFQAQRAARGFDLLEKAAEQLPRISWDDLDRHAPMRLDAVLRAGTAYESVCVGFCDRAPTCHARAVREGNPVILGDDVARLLGTITLPRALDLMDGARARTLAESELQRLLAASEFE